jgi:dihydroxy-acid dehydratase
MPEWGMLPIPRKLLEAGVRDMVLISDARMSGTAYGTCVLHVAPESFKGGPLALVQSGDLVTLDVPSRRLDLQVPVEELAARRSSWVPRDFPATRGYERLFASHVTQAPEGCDFDFLHGAGGVPEPAIH